MIRNETVYTSKEGLLQECEAYIRHNEDIDPVRVQQMIKDAFKHGYDEAMNK